jgi:beta-glucanase (GH16 family)
MDARLSRRSLLVTALTSITEADAAPSVPLRKGTPTFADEFDRLDLQKWQTVFPWGLRRIGNGDVQIYTDASFIAGHPGLISPFSIGNGILTIQATRVPGAMAYQVGGRYTSGMLCTANTFLQRYGLFEIRTRLPYGRGMWPAFWLIEKKPDFAPPPPEIDVFELVGSEPTTLYATVHTHRNGLTGPDKGIGFKIPVSDMTKAFHTYSVFWNEKHVAFYFDDQKVAHVPTPIDMHNPMYMIVNLAIGGWSGAASQPDSSTKFPAKMEIDYIRAYNV